MKGASQSRPYAEFRKRSRARSGYSMVVSAAIMITAVAMLGSVMLIWANSNFNAQQRQMGDYYEQTSNTIKEMYIIEDVWLSESPADYVNVTIRNVGSIALNITQVKIVALNSTDAQVRNATLTPAIGIIPVRAEGNNTLQADVNIQWDDPQVAKLDVSVTTMRGSIERILWKV